MAVCSVLVLVVDNILTCRCATHISTVGRLISRVDRWPKRPKDKREGRPWGAEGGLSRGEPEGAAAQHGGGDASHDRLGLDV